jgi:TetR/AcrR family acrAB operon transcriptional repressor
MRRTKEEAEETRRQILAAALRCFGRHGIARSSLEMVSREAGVSRGAVYWHFKGKRELFRAVRDTVSLPLLDQVDLTSLHSPGSDPLQRMEDYMLGLVDEIERNRALRKTFEIMSFKCEYVGEIAAERNALAFNTERVQKAFERAYRSAAKEGLLRADVDARIAAFETVALVTGLCRMLLLDGNRFKASAARASVLSHVASRRPVRSAMPARAGPNDRRRVRPSGPGLPAVE